MHVGLNLLYLVPGETGGRETYARELIPRLAERGLRLTSYVNREAAADPRGPWHAAGKVVKVPVSGRGRAGWAAAEHLLLPRLAARGDVEVLHSLANFAPLWGRFARVLTVHDLLYRRHPEFLTLVMRAGTRALLPPAVRRSDRVITVSAASRDELTSLLGTSPEKIDVVPNGVAPPGIAPTPEGELRERMRLNTRPLVLCVATHLPHKNLIALVEAAGRLPAEERPLFVLAGARAQDGELASHALRLDVQDSVRVLGFVDRADLEGLYGAASCLVVPSLYEGFGLPVVEAMARGLPVACSDIAPLREVAGDAAVFFDPRDPAGIGTAVRRLLSDAGERERLTAAGREHAARFTWEAAAAAVARSYERALAQR